MKWLAAAAAGFLLVASGVWVLIKDKNGKEIGRLQLPEGGSAIVLDDPAKGTNASPLGLPSEDSKSSTSIRPIAVGVPAIVPMQNETPLPGILLQPAILPGLKRWNLETVKPRTTIWLGKPMWAPDGNSYAFACPTHVRVYEVNGTDTKLKHILPEPYSGSAFVNVTWSPDSSRLAVLGRGGKVYVWSVLSSSPHIAQTIPPGNNPRPETEPDSNEIAWCPDGSLIATTHSSNINLWDSSTGRLKKRLQGHSGSVGALAWRRDGARLASGGTSDEKVIIWDVESEQITHTIAKKKGEQLALAWSPDGRQLGTALLNSSTVTIWDADKGTVLRELTPTNKMPARSVEWSPDGRWVVTGDLFNANVWRSDDGTILRTLRHFDATIKVNPVTGTIVGINRDNLSSLEGIATSRSRAEQLEYVSRFSWSPDGTFIATTLGAFGPQNKRSMILLLPWSLTQSPKVLKPDVEGINAIIWNANSRHLTLAGREKIQKWDTFENKPYGNSVAIDSGVFARVVSGGGDGGFAMKKNGSREVTVFDGDSLKPRFTLSGQSQDTQEIAMSGDGRRLVTRDRKSVQVWDLADGKSTNVIEFSNSSASISPTGDRVVICEYAYPAPNSHKVFDAQGVRKFTLDCPGAYGDCYWSPDGCWIVGLGHSDFNFIALYESGTGKLIHRLPCPLFQIQAQWDPTSRYLAVTQFQDNCLYILDAAAGKWVRSTAFFSGGRTATVLASGELTYSEPSVESELIYIVEGANGGFETLTPADFRTRVNRNSSVNSPTTSVPTAVSADFGTTPQPSKAVSSGKSSPAIQPPQEPWQVAQTSLAESLFLVVVEEPKSGAMWAIANATALSETHLLTNGLVAIEIAKFQKKGWKVHVMRKSLSERTPVAKILVQAGAQIKQPAEQIYFDYGLLVAAHPLSGKPATLASPAEISAVERGVSLASVAIDYSEDPLDRFQPMEPQFLSNKVFAVTRLTDKADAPQLARVRGKFVNKPIGCPIINEQGHVVGVYADAEKSDPNSAQLQIHYTPILTPDLVEVGLQEQANQVWVTPVVPNEPPTKLK